MTLEAKISWSKNEMRTIEKVSQLDGYLAQIASIASDARPLIADVTFEGMWIQLGFDGEGRGFLSYQNISGDPPYYATIHGDNTGGITEFFYMGDSTEIENKHIIATSDVREALISLLEDKPWPEYVKRCEI